MPQGAETTPLAPREEAAFRAWALSSGITDVDDPRSFYDYRGYWKDIASRGADQRKRYDDGLHFPDTYKQHGHPTFSIESKYSRGPSDGGRWEGETYVPQGQAADPVADILRTVQTSDRLRAAAWDAAYSSDDPNEVATRLKALPIGDSARAKLWDARFAAAPDQTAPAAAPVNEAYTQSRERPGQYVHDMLTNVPGDLARQARGMVTGTGDLLATMAKATGEAGAGAGNFMREVVGLQPNASAGTENLQRLAGIPRAVVSHYGQYLDPEYRAERVRNEPVGMALDMMPVAEALRVGVPAGARAVKRGASMVKSVPGRAVDTAVALYRGNPVGIVKGVTGQGPMEKALANQRAAIAAESAVSPAVSSPAVPAPSAAQNVPESGSADLAAPAPSRMSPQMIQNQLGIQARRQGVTLTEPQYQAATDLVSQGRTPADAVTQVVRQTTAPTVAKAVTTPASQAAPAKAARVPKRARMTADEADEYLRLTGKGLSNEEAVAALMQQRQLAKKLGTPSPETVRQRVAARNATGRWPENK